MWVILANVFSGQTQQAQLLMVAGFIMLGWVLARRQIRLRKQVKRDSRASRKAIAAIRDYKEPAVPLADAPPETQRWQVAMFDLQRELKAELDTRIVIVQTLMRQLDERIEKLERVASSSVTNDAVPHEEVRELLLAGHTAREIAQRINLPLGDVEFAIATMTPGPLDS